jgi:YD repeat-containing protein
MVDSLCEFLLASYRPSVRQFRQSLHALLIGLCSLFCLGNAIAADVIHYYDPLGRLVETVGPDGSSVQYAYDAVGNVTSVRRKLAGTLSISGFIPASGDVGTTVTVIGSGFDPVASNNTVKLNGQAVAVLSATATSLAFQVPSGASTGLIQITNTNGTAQSASQFVVAASKAPKLTSFAPTIAVQGTPITISGSGFQTAAIANKVLFGRINGAVASANSTTISAVSPIGMRAGKISVTTPYGVATATSDFFAVPPDSLASDVALTSRMSIDGPSQAVSLAAGKKALLIFDGILGKTITIGESGFSGTTMVMTLYRSDGSQLATSTFAWNQSVRVDAPLTSETYTIQVAAHSAGSGAVNITLSTDLTGVLPTNGTVVPFTTSKPAQRGRYTFTATAGMNLVLNSTGSTFSDSGDLKVFKPDGTQLSGTSIGGLLYSTNLPATGTYTVTVEPYRASTGTVNLSLTLANDVNSPIAVDGSATAASLTAGQRGNYTFTGTAGQNLGFGFAGLSGALPTFSVLKPDGSQLWTPQYPSSRGSYNLTTLPVNGTYTLRVVPSDVTGAMSVNLWLSRELTGTLTSGAAPVTFSTARPGQNGRYTFSATAGQNLVLNSTNSTFSSAGTITVLMPDGSQLNATGFGSRYHRQR